jgi:hypothetical protein
MIMHRRGVNLMKYYQTIVVLQQLAGEVQLKRFLNDRAFFASLPEIIDSFLAAIFLLIVT